MQRFQSCRIGARSFPPSPRLPNLYRVHSQTTTQPRRWALRSQAFTTTLPRAEIQKTPVPSVKDEIITAAPPAPSSILDRLPAFARPIKPYLELTRIDKPIGTLLLYWPCGELMLQRKRTTSHLRLSSVVDHNGIHSKSPSLINTLILPRAVRHRRSHHAWRGMHHQ